MLNIGDEKNNYIEFLKSFVETLDKHAPKKTKIFRRNNKPHINKTLRKAIIKRSHLENKTNKMKDPKHILKYKNNVTILLNSTINLCRNILIV